MDGTAFLQSRDNCACMCWSPQFILPFPRLPWNDAVEAFVSFPISCSGPGRCESFFRRTESQRLRAPTTVALQVHISFEIQPWLFIDQLFSHHFQAGFLRKRLRPLSGILFLLYSEILARVSRPEFLQLFRLKKFEGGVAQLVRAPACHAGGRRFESGHPRLSIECCGRRSGFRDPHQIP